MIWIIEGCDGVGKTTLAYEILKQTKGHLLHATYNKDWNIQEYHRELYRIAEQLNEYQDVVIDRWAPSEAVYGKVFRNNDVYDTNSLIINEVNTDKTTWIYCRNDNAVKNHNKNKKTREEMYDDIEKVAKEYDKYIKKSFLKWIEYDFDKVNRLDFVNKLIKGEL